MKARERFIAAVNQRMGRAINDADDRRNRSRWDDWPALDDALSAYVGHAVHEAIEQYVKSEAKPLDVEIGMSDCMRCGGPHEETDCPNPVPRSEPANSKLSKLQQLGDDAAFLTLVGRAVAEERERLKPWLDHRYKCAVNRAIREDRVCPPCDCGWDEQLVAMGWRKP